MANIFIINAHHYYPCAQGKLNKTLVEIATEVLRKSGHIINTTHVDNDWDIEEELEKHKWSDIVLLQSPVYWMMVPWMFKKYMDEVYSAGMRGILCKGDGRDKHKYGEGGTMQSKKYMFSLTFNAPEECFDDPNEYLFQGKNVDDLWFPMHANFRFFGMVPLPTFACFDVIKNTNVKKDIERFKIHLNNNI